MVAQAPQRGLLKLTKPAGIFVQLIFVAPAVLAPMSALGAAMNDERGIFIGAALQPSRASLSRSGNTGRFAENPLMLADPLAARALPTAPFGMTGPVESLSTLSTTSPFAPSSSRKMYYANPAAWEFSESSLRPGFPRNSRGESVIAGEPAPRSRRRGV